MLDRGAGPGFTLAVDNTLGSFSPYQGRVYVAYAQSSNGSTSLRVLHSDDASLAAGPQRKDRLVRRMLPPGARREDLPQNPHVLGAGRVQRLPPRRVVPPHVVMAVGVKAARQIGPISLLADEQRRDRARRVLGPFFVGAFDMDDRLHGSAQIIVMDHRVDAEIVRPGLDEVGREPRLMVKVAGTGAAARMIRNQPAGRPGSGPRRCRCAAKTRLPRPRCR